MTEHILTKIPDSLAPLIESGAAYIRGVNVHDAATGLIKGQLQQTGQLTQQLTEAAATGDPALAIIKLTSAVVGNFQKEILRRQNIDIVERLGKISKQLDALAGQVRGVQILSGVGAAASVLNLGVSVAGFVLVLRRLDGMGERIDEIGEKVFAAHDRTYKVDVITALRRSEEAFEATEDRQTEMWETCEEKLDTAFTHFLITTSGASLDAPEEAGAETSQRLFFNGQLKFHEAVDLLDWMVTTARARHEALLLAGQPGVAEQFTRKLADWLRSVEFDPAELAAHRLPKGKIVSTQLRHRIEVESQYASLWVESVRRVTESNADAAAALREYGIDSRRLVIEARGHHEPALMYIPLDELPEAEKSVGRERVAP